MNKLKRKRSRGIAEMNDAGEKSPPKKRRRREETETRANSAESEEKGADGDVVKRVFAHRRSIPSGHVEYNVLFSSGDRRWTEERALIAPELLREYVRRETERQVCVYVL